MVHHPLSPFKGQHYVYPVELIDVYPTVLDLLQVPQKDGACAHRTTNTKNGIFHDCVPLQGKSLAPVVLGNLWEVQLKKMAVGRSKSETRKLQTEAIVNSPVAKESNRLKRQHYLKHSGDNGAGGAISPKQSHGAAAGKAHAEHQRGQHKVPRHPNSVQLNYSSPNDVTFAHDFSLTQFWRCLPYEEFSMINTSTGTVFDHNAKVVAFFRDCSMDEKSYNYPDKHLMIMGYSMRTLEYRYTAWLHFNASTLKPVWDPASSAASILGQPVTNFTLHHGGSILMPAFEELYRHHINIADEKFTQEELDNLATIRIRMSGNNLLSAEEIETKATLESYRVRLIEYLRRHVEYSGRH